MFEVTIPEWNAYLSNHPDAHLLQTSAWGDLKSAFGWDVTRVLPGGDPDQSGLEVGAQILFRRLPLGFSLAYIPKGPVGVRRESAGINSWEGLWQELDALCRERRAVFLKVELDLWETSNGVNNAPETQGKPLPSGFRHSQHDIQPRSTLVVDLHGDEDQILARMKQKTRYNIRLALKKGVVVYPSSDVDTFYRLMTITGERDRFGYHSLAYYKRAFELFYPHGECELLMAEYQGEPLAALMVFARGKRAWYFYGASASQHRERMPTYLLQWEAMRWARSRGCSTYDLWGVPDYDVPTLEANFTKRSEGLWGVYRFKRGFGGQLQRAYGSWDRVYRPALYAFYRWWVGRGERVS